MSDETEESLAALGLDESDETVLGRIAELYESVDPLPPGMVERIQFALTLEALHAEVAELQRLTEGSFAHRAETAGVYSVTFASASMTTMISVTGTSFGRVRIDGWIAPALPVLVELHLPDHAATAAADDNGRFVFDDVPRGVAQFVLRSPDAGQPPVITPSMEL